jgi:hypothetical protein
MRRFLNWLGPTRRANTRRANRRYSFRPQIEQLDERLVPSNLGLSSAVTTQHSGKLFGAPISWTEQDVYTIDGNTGHVVEFCNNVVFSGTHKQYNLGGPNNVFAVSASIDPQSGKAEVFALALSSYQGSVPVGNLWFCDPSGTWHELGGLYTAISATHDGHVYGIDSSKGDVWYIDSNNNGTYLGSPQTGSGSGVGENGYSGSLAASVSWFGGNEVFALGKDHGIYVNSANTSGKWQLVSYQATFIALSASTDDTVFALTLPPNQYVGNGEMLYEATEKAVSFGGFLGAIYWSCQQISGNGSPALADAQISADLDASGQAEVYVTAAQSNLNLFDQAKWMQKDSGVYDFAAAGGGYFYDVNYALGIFPAQMDSPNGTANSISLASGLDSGSHFAYGAIGAEYDITADETDYGGNVVQTILGQPTSAETNVFGVSRMMTFHGGDISWSPRTGAHVVYGLIGVEYNRLGGPKGDLGLPTADEQEVAGDIGRFSDFQFGTVYWTPTAGTYDLVLQDDSLAAAEQCGASNGIIDRNAMLAVYQYVENQGSVSLPDFDDLQTLAAAPSYVMPDDVSKLANKVVGNDPGNSTYQYLNSQGKEVTTSLGNLQVGSSRTQLTHLVNKWFMGVNEPAAATGYSVVTGNLFGSNGPVYTDVEQGAVGDCWLMASLAEAADQQPSLISNMFSDDGTNVVNGQTVDVYTVRLFTNGAADYVIVDTELPSGGGYYDHPANGTLWAALAEKAYVEANGSGMVQTGSPLNNSYGAVNDGYASWALTAITGQSVSTPPLGLFPPVAAEVAYQAGQFVVLCTDSPQSQYIVPSHCYALVGYDSSSDMPFTVYNPWGTEASGWALGTYNGQRVWGLFRANAAFISQNFDEQDIAAAARGKVAQPLLLGISTPSTQNAGQPAAPLVAPISVGGPQVVNAADRTLNHGLSPSAIQELSVLPLDYFAAHRHHGENLESVDFSLDASPLLQRFGE